MVADEGVVGRGPHLRRDEVTEMTGAVVAIDVIRAFTTSAHAFDAGAMAIYLVNSVAEALAFKTAHPPTVARRGPNGFG